MNYNFAVFLAGILALGGFAWVLDNSTIGKAESQTVHHSRSRLGEVQRSEIQKSGVRVLKPSGFWLLTLEE
jgi:hypothetical protein